MSGTKRSTPLVGRTQLPLDGSSTTPTIGTLPRTLTELQHKWPSWPSTLIRWTPFAPNFLRSCFDAQWHNFNWHFASPDHLIATCQSPAVSLVCHVDCHSHNFCVSLQAFPHLAHQVRMPLGIPQVYPAPPKKWEKHHEKKCGHQKMPPR